MTTKQSITFPDGYTVTLSDAGLLEWTHNGKGGAAHVTHFREFAEVDPKNFAVVRIRTFLEKQNRNESDYLVAPAVDRVIRAGNGVREMVARERIEWAEKTKRENDAADAKRIAEIAAAQGKCTLQDPVNVAVSYHDGYPFAVRIDGVEHTGVDWDEVQIIDNFGFAAQAEIDRLKSVLQAKQEQQRQEQQRLAQKVNDAKAEAQKTGKPVVIARWTTDRCMSRHRDCSFDNATQVVLPDGTTRIKYTCCY